MRAEAGTDNIRKTWRVNHDKGGNYQYGGQRRRWEDEPGPMDRKIKYLEDEGYNGILQRKDRFHCRKQRKRQAGTGLQGPCFRAQYTGSGAACQGGEERKDYAEKGGHGMKINISYRPDSADEERQIHIIRSFFKGFLPGAKVSISNRNSPYLPIHWSTKKAENQIISEDKTEAFLWKEKSTF